MTAGKSQQSKMLFFSYVTVENGRFSELGLDVALFTVPGKVSGFGAVGNSLNNNLSYKAPTDAMPHVCRQYAAGDMVKGLWF